METLIKLLSAYRQEGDGNAAHPKTITRRSLLKIWNESLPPEQTQTKEDFKKLLDELEVQGELIQGQRGWCCIAPPTVIAKSTNDLKDLQFKGDRCYLKFAHYALETGKPIDRLEFNARNKTFEEAKQRLQGYGIRLVTWDNLIAWLPKPQKPQLFEADSIANPFLKLKLEEVIEKYDPRDYYESQKERSKKISASDLTESCLLFHGNYRQTKYYWFERPENRFYELSRDQGTLAMFWLDQEKNYPLIIPCDQKIDHYELDLKGIFLPYAYYQFIYQRSTPSDNSDRLRQLDPQNYSLIKKVLEEKLGCRLA